MKTKTITHYTKYGSPRRFACSPNRFGQVALTSYGRANLTDGTSYEIENPDFGSKHWKAKGVEVCALSLSDKRERHPLTRID